MLLKSPYSNAYTNSYAAWYSLLDRVAWCVSMMFSETVISPSNLLFFFSAFYYFIFLVDRDELPDSKPVRCGDTECNSIAAEQLPCTNKPIAIIANETINSPNIVAENVRVATVEKEENVEEMAEEDLREHEDVSKRRIISLKKSLRKCYDDVPDLGSAFRSTPNVSMTIMKLPSKPIITE